MLSGTDHGRLTWVYVVPLLKPVTPCPKVLLFADHGAVCCALEHGALYGTPGMYVAHCARVSGWPRSAQTAARASAGSVSHVDTAPRSLVTATCVPAGVKATEETCP